jgi:CDP-diacylglycerol---glycerol-3-phosphate 3-phosphatidyltransferase
MNLPNSLTLIRIFLVPLLVVVLLTKVEWPVMGVSSQVLGATIFGLASLTDWLDGYVARRRKQVTPLGQMMDPIADKLLTAAAFISLVQMNAAPAWMVAVIIGREFAVTGLRSLAYSRGAIIAATAMGKAKMTSQVVAILLLILGHEGYHPFYVLGQAALWVVLVLSVVSGVDYYRRYARATPSS